jgi:diaminopimelate epimerase
MQIHFTKYQGTGNDFILLDNRLGNYSSLHQQDVARLCDRRFGIGADGLMLVENSPAADFKMVYYNSDGNVSSMCGNGGRCISAYAQEIGIIEEKTIFEAIDGLHEAIIKPELVSLKMIEVIEIMSIENDFVLNTGSPHYVRFVEDVDSLDVFAMGRQIRYSERFKAEGINVNFVQIMDQGISVRTYERGVEAETYSCGTGVVASSIIASSMKLKNIPEVSVSTPGGPLMVRFEQIGKQHFQNIWLSGKAEKVFEGHIQISR